MVGDHIYLNIGGIFSLKPFNLTGIAGGFLFISHSFDEPLLKQYKKTKRPRSPEALWRDVIIKKERSKETVIGVCSFDNYEYTRLM